jgi:hypothetical protein
MNEYPDRDEHVILYAKNWYVKGDAVEDVCTIYAKCNKLNMVSKQDAWSLLLSLVESIDPHKFKEILYSMFNGEKYNSLCIPFQIFSNKAEPPTLEQMFHKCLNVLGHITLANIKAQIGIDLGNPDPNILPLKRDEKGAA